MMNNEKIAVYIILPNILKDKILKRLNENSFECTLLSTTGAYLRAGQTTVLSIINEGDLPKLTGLIEQIKTLHNENYSEKIKGILIFSIPVIDFNVI